MLPDGTMNPAGMNSLNHYSYGAVMEFVYEHAAGIRPDGNGFRRVILAPNPHAQLSYISGSYQSTAGKIVSNWSIREDGTLRCYFEVPFNVEATIVLPYSTEAPFKVTSGIYEYTYQPVKDLRTMYNLDTRLSVIKKNAQAFEQLLAVDESLTRFVQRADEEQLNFSIREVANLFFTGVTREAADKAEQLLLGMTVSR
ncbi:Bacterial alpha-L-rhamnosidase [compost metagenome]